MAFQKGDVVLVPIPFTNLQTSKVRPAVVLSSPTYHATEPDLILGAITTRASRPWPPPLWLDPAARTGALGSIQRGRV